MRFETHIKSSIKTEKNIGSYICCLGAIVLPPRELGER